MIYRGWNLYGSDSGTAGAEAWRYGVRLRARNTSELRTMIDLREAMPWPTVAMADAHEARETQPPTRRGGR